MKASAWVKNNYIRQLQKASTCKLSSNFIFSILKTEVAFTDINYCIRKTCNIKYRIKFIINDNELASFSCEIKNMKTLSCIEKIYRICVLSKSGSGLSKCSASHHQETSGRAYVSEMSPLPNDRNLLNRCSWREACPFEVRRRLSSDRRSLLE
jgi:hypothetical protein